MRKLKILLCVFLCCAVECKKLENYDALSVRNKLFRCEKVDGYYEQLHYHALDKIELCNNTHYPKIAFCNVKKGNRYNKKDRELFLKSVASTVFWVNKNILEQRKIVETVNHKRKLGINLSEKESDIFACICKFYQTKNINELLSRVAPVSVSLATAQAAYESGFGTDNIMHRNNAFFGMMHSNGRFLSFEKFFESAIAYSKTLNVNSAYKKFRNARLAMIKDNKSLNGLELSKSLNLYSATRGYDKYVNQIIREYQLSLLDKPV